MPRDIEPPEPPATDPPRVPPFPKPETPTRFELALATLEQEIAAWQQEVAAWLASRPQDPVDETTIRQCFPERSRHGRPPGLDDDVSILVGRAIWLRDKGQAVFRQYVAEERETRALASDLRTALARIDRLYPAPRAPLTELERLLSPPPPKRWLWHEMRAVHAIVSAALADLPPSRRGGRKPGRPPTEQDWVMRALAAEVVAVLEACGWSPSDISDHEDAALATTVSNIMKLIGRSATPESVREALHRKR